MASFLSLVSSNSKPTPFGIFDNDSHFQEDADNIIVYVKRRLGDDIMSVELTSKQIWANFEEAVLEFSKQVNSHQAESYMSNLLGLSTGHMVSYKKNTFGHYYFVRNNQVEDNVKDTQPLLIQDTNDPRFKITNKEGRYKTVDGVRTIVITVETDDGLNTGNIVLRDEQGFITNDGTGSETTVETSASPLEDKKLGPHGQEQRFPRETLEYLTRRAEPYAFEAGVGGVTDSVRGYIELKHDVQDYNIYTDMVIPGPAGEKLKLTSYDPNSTAEQLSLFNPLYKNQILNTAEPTKIKVQEIYHFSPQAAYRFFDTTSAINYLNNQFSFESFTPETVFYVLPVFEDLLRASQLDISNRVRRSNFSYRLQGQSLRIFPRPTQSNPLNLFIKFTFPSQPYKTALPYEDETIDGVSNISNIPFGNIMYSKINAMSRQWIRQYTMALCKETLGLVRSKFSTVPIPGSDLSMNGADLLSQGREDKTRLLEGIKETLDRLTYQKLLEADSAQADTMTNILKKVPIPNGRAIIIG